MSPGRRRWAPRSLLALALALPQLKKNSDGQGAARVVAGMGWAAVSSWMATGRANDHVGFAGALWLALACWPETCFSTIPAPGAIGVEQGGAGP
jgi:hypothetical protein